MTLKAGRLLMQFAIKLLISVSIIIFCVLVGKKAPTLSGLIATAPITTLIVLLWLYSDNPGNYKLIKNYTKGVLWGIIPATCFFLAAYFCFHKRFGIWTTLAVSGLVWLGAAIVHQWLLNK